MPRTGSTRWTFWTISALIVGLSGSALANPASAQTAPAAAQAPTPPPDSGAQKPPEPPPAAVGEEGTKPRRGFVSALTHNLKDAVTHIPRWNSVFAIGVGGALALGAHSHDPDINRHFVGSADNVWKAGAFIGQTPTILGAGLATYIVGRFTSSPRAQHLGMDEIEATLLAGGIVFGMKQAVRRDRPLAPDGQRQSGFSFPSGHAAATFAAATVLQQHLGYRAGVPTYLVASYVAMSRLHDNKHFASDVIFGSAIGVVVGRSVTWHGRHFYASPLLLPDGGGLMVSLSPHP
jgi:PAP2 superfamily